MDRDTLVPLFNLRASSFCVCLLSSLALTPMGEAQALGLGRPHAHSVLGQPLVLSFPLSLRAGESLSMECVFAEVTAGTAKLPAGVVSVRLEGESETDLRAVRVLSSVPIEEPILSVSLSLGCPVRLTRQFSALMDPPSAHEAIKSDARSTLASPRILSPALRAALATSEAQPKALMGAGLANSIGQERLSASSASKAVPAATGKGGVEQAKKLADNKASKRSGGDTDLLEGASSAKATKGAGLNIATASSLAASSTGAKAGPMLEQGARAAGTGSALPQLRLEAFDAASTLANNSAAAAMAAEAAMARLLTVESGLLGMQSENRSNALKVSSLREAIAAGPVASSGPLDQVPVAALIGAMTLLLGCGLGYLLRGRPRDKSSRDSNWWRQEPAGASAAAEEKDESALRSSDVSRPEPLAPPEPQLRSDMASNAGNAGNAGFAGAGFARQSEAQEHTISTPPNDETDFASAKGALLAEANEKEVSGLDRLSDLMAGDLSLEPLSVQFIDPSASQPAAINAEGNMPAGGPNLVSVEELIDLEQQVDFFLVLGQDEAALDLLHAQLKNGVDRGGGGSALPYLKLMEICQQRGDALAFADIAGRFAVQFNAPAPAWELDLALGRGLEAYADVMQGLQSRWSNSGASMVALQKLLSANDGRSVCFDLPALRDLLLLYSVARDRSEHEVRGEEIDLFLPLERDVEAATPTGFDLMATMVWQSKSADRSAPLDVDILLDESNATTSSATSTTVGGLSKL